MNFSSTALNIITLFNDQKIYTVPLFQRSYSWSAEQIEEFYTDIIYYAETVEEKEYFIGTMVFSPHSDENKLVILDGQQRFASIFIFLAALRSCLQKQKSSNNDEWIEDINRVLYRRITPSKEKSAKLELNKEDNQYFSELIFIGELPKSKIHSHMRIKENYNFLFDKISKGLEAIGENFIQKIMEVVFKKISIIKIEVSNEINANLLFETLNDRGLDLSAADLIKNYIYSLNLNNLEQVSSNWERMNDQIGENNISRYLRHYWISNYDFVKKEHLYKNIKSKISKNKIKIFSESISEESIIYSNLNYPSLEYWEDHEIIQLLDDLKILRVEQVNIFLLAVSKKLFDKKERIKRLLRVIVNFTFRYNTIAGLDPKVLEKLYGNLATDLRMEKKSVSEIINEIKKQNPDSDLFKASFMNFQSKNTKLSKYILYNINQKLLRDDRKSDLSANKDEINLEHIIPKNPNSDWQKILKQEQTDLNDILYKIGNQTILLKEYNKKAANLDFSKKVEIYKLSNLPINHFLKDLKTFSSVEVQNRQKEFAEIADKIWVVQ
jgi:uncharacterized protein with ParB-like and HNH nuclease domain